MLTLGSTMAVLKRNLHNGANPVLVRDRMPFRPIPNASTAVAAAPKQENKPTMA